MSSEAIVFADVVSDVAVFLLSLEPLLVVAHIEERFEGVLARRIVRVEIVLLLTIGLRLLDIPENVRG